MNGFISGAAPGIDTSYLSEVERPCYEYYMNTNNFISFKSDAMAEIKKDNTDFVVSTNYITKMALALFNHDCITTTSYDPSIKTMRANLFSLENMIATNNLEAKISELENSSAWKTGQVKTVYWFE